MTVHVRADRPASTPHGVEFTEAGQVIAMDDHAAARELIKIEGFSEVVPPPVPAGPTDEEVAAQKAAADKAAADKAAADAEAEAEAAKAAKGARGKAVTE